MDPLKKKKQRYYFANKGLSSQSNGLSSSHIWVWDLDHKVGWVLKYWCFQIVVLSNWVSQSLLRVLWTASRSNPGNPKGNPPWIFIRRTAAKAEALIFWPPDVKNQFIEKDPDAEKDWKQMEKGVAENEMVR